MSAPANTETLQKTDVGVFLSNARQRICTSSAVEIAELSAALIAASRQEDRDYMPALVRGLSMRIEGLAGIIMGAVDDEAETLDGLSSELYGAEEVAEA
jgi:hypothetical protein